MRRRDFIKVIAGSAAAWPLDARALQVRGIPTVGVLTATVESDAESQTRITAFRQSFERLSVFSEPNRDRASARPHCSGENACKHSRGNGIRRR